MQTYGQQQCIEHGRMQRVGRKQKKTGTEEARKRRKREEPAWTAPARTTQNGRTWSESSAQTQSGEAPPISCVHYICVSFLWRDVVNGAKKISPQNASMVLQFVGVARFCRSTCNLSFQLGLQSCVIHPHNTVLRRYGPYLDSPVLFVRTQKWLHI